ncbi:MAG TPA: substrate-binding domain-containing protein [Candidatus Baltobacteraceae bacterium]|nr:substrate-binding domain-containing protein [Candidatus Baltobacteraceae bacterium]
MKRSALLAAAMLALLPTFDASAAPSAPVSVAYAGSLVATMEGPLKAALREETGLRFAGEAKGSRALANLIAAGLRTPDVFISADPALVAKLDAQHLVRGYAVFGSARMVIAYSRNSPHRALFQRAAAGRISILDVLADPSVSAGRTDPQLDPKGARTVRVLHLLGKHFHDPGKAAGVERKAETFPEEDLAVRVESGEVDAGFFYSTEIPGRDLHAIELPADANLSHDITYALAVMKGAPHPQAARTFAQFVLAGAGRTILERAGVRYFARPRSTGTM